MAQQSLYLSVVWGPLRIEFNSIQATSVSKPEFHGCWLAFLFQWASCTACTWPTLTVFLDSYDGRAETVLQCMLTAALKCSVSFFSSVGRSSTAWTGLAYTLNVRYHKPFNRIEELFVQLLSYGGITHHPNKQAAGVLGEPVEALPSSGVSVFCFCIMFCQFSLFLLISLLGWSNFKQSKRVSNWRCCCLRGEVGFVVRWWSGEIVCSLLSSLLLGQQYYVHLKLIPCQKPS